MEEFQDIVVVPLNSMTSLYCSITLDYLMHTNSISDLSELDNKLNLVLKSTNQGHLFCIR